MYCDYTKNPQLTFILIAVTTSLWKIPEEGKQAKPENIPNPLHVVPSLRNARNSESSNAKLSHVPMSTLCTSQYDVVPPSCFQVA